MSNVWLLFRPVKVELPVHTGVDAEMSEIVRLITERDAAAAAAKKVSKEAAGAETEKDVARSAAEVRTASLDSLRQKGNELLKKGEVAEAVQMYEKCLELDPGSIPVHANLALAKVRPVSFKRGLSSIKIWPLAL